MYASNSFSLSSTKTSKSQPLSYPQNLSGFISKRHFANRSGSLGRSLSTAENSFTLTIYSKLSIVRSFCGSRNTRSLAYLSSSHFGSSWPRRSNSSRTLSKSERRTLTVPSAGGVVPSETLWSPLVTGFLLEGDFIPKLTFLLSDIFTDVSSNSVLYSFTLVTTILGISGAFYAQASRESEGKRQNLLESDRTSESARAEGFSNWLNLSQPTPFNKFVAARCPSLALPLGERRYSRNAESESEQVIDPPEYQRLCLHADDGGTVALDWPTHLDLEKNKELENVLVIIPGSTEGSEEEGICKFTRVAEQRGYFPIVLNPRGCGGSPLTSPRIFSAADSDDVRLLAQYVAKRRPWATIMAIGWGFGANMLAKYLGEEANATPLTAAVCIDNPFSLDKDIHSAPPSRWSSLDRALTKGLIQILDNNKKLFQGDRKGFDVSGSLAATSLSEFETGISRVAHGYDSLEKFYEDVSSQATLERVQIPVLCIQHVQDYSGNQISLSQEAIVKNPYATLLVYPSDIKDFSEGPDFPGTASERTHETSLEWLAAVEVALLKGRHPLSNVVDLTIRPTKEWSSVGNQVTSTASSMPVSKPATTSTVNASHMVDSDIIDVTGDVSDMSEHSEVHEQDSLSTTPAEASKLKPYRDDGSEEASRQDHAVIVQSSGDAIKSPAHDPAKSDEETTSAELTTTSDVAEGEEANPEEVETGQVQLAAESVMKVLDVTMPGTLSAQQKQQVVEAVGRGESLVGALQEAVPEDVRGKISGAVSAAVQAKGISLKTAGFGDKIPAPQIPSGLTESLKAKLAGLTARPGDSNGDHGLAESQSPEKRGSDNDKKVDSSTHSDSSVHESSESSAEKQSPAKTGSDERKSSADSNKDTGGQGDNKMNDDTKKDAPKANADVSKSTDDIKKDGASNESSEDSSRQAQDTVSNHDEQKAHNSGHSEDKAAEKESNDSSTNRQATANVKEGDAGTHASGNKGEVGNSDSVNADSSKASVQEGDKKIEEQPGAATSESEQKKDEPTKQDSNSSGQISDINDSKGEASPSSNEGAEQKPQNDAPATENTVSAPVPPQPPVPDQVPPVPSVGQALQALTGFDDATQMAVTNVFGVVENVLDELEKGKSPEEKNPTPKENEEQEAKKSRSSGKTHETGDSTTVADFEKEDSSDSESDDEHDKGVDQRRTNEVSKDERVGTAVSQGGSQRPFGSTRSLDRVRNSAGQIVQTHGVRGGPEVDGQSEENGSLGPSGNGSLHSNGDARKFEDKVPQKYVGSSELGLVNMDKARNYHNVSEYDEPQLAQRSISVLQESTNQAQTSPVGDLRHSSNVSDDGNESRLDAMAAEIDREDEDNAKKVLEADKIKLANSNDTNSGEEKHNVVKDVVMNALKLEVVRRVGGAGMDALGLDFEAELSKVAHAVSEAVKQGQETILDMASDREVGGEGGGKTGSLQSDSTGKLGVLNGNNIVRNLSTVLGSTTTLGSLIPFGVLVGVVLAALGALFLIVTDDHDEEKNAELTGSSESEKTSSISEELDSEKSPGHVLEDHSGVNLKQDWTENSSEKGSSSVERNVGAEQGITQTDSEHDLEDDKGPANGKLMGAITAAMGATAAVASQSQASTAVHSEQSHSSENTESDGSEAQGFQDSGDGNSKSRLVPEIAEKAISMVSPVVPKKEDGQVDQDRLVAMLAEVGQRGGILTLVGKVALLWGGLRGAMSLVDRLLGFLRIKDRPLQQRLLGFLGMALLLWTPVLVPLLPTLLQQWATKSPNGVADAAAGIGLYGAVFILITIWGKRVRGYDRPLVSYGLELLSRAKLRFVGIGLAIGANLVTAYYGINWALGYAQISWASIVVESPSFPGPAATAILTSWKFFQLIGQSLSMALIVALVEELLFRAWLQEEVAVDLGYHWGILLSSLVFAVVHWSPPAMVGLWFLSISLAGARSAMGGDLSLPIGIHAGIVAAFSVVNLGGLAHYLPAAPAWFTGAYAGNPLAGALGTSMVAALAIFLYPRKQVLSSAEEDDYGDES
ncbi:CAAX protease family protein [Marchantia polymorpha subsp. ruderalis]|uniref:CAAX amino terminal protease n=2 Tax=Marchantia polymorpha TaxID=3197 RepID=A0AAF6BEX6_MARPO|nr:hypothetical protein MARPO_0027s0173 [Marchantia polymorpha]BBN10560.1 hypothetical protein Mp_5g04530 [Marchantia polymorpha subsp. ruderalis]|eukprot:PTQ43074.1 hypothetical protein MARPO_0027s0173 [Marchantia polymorpha]